MTPGPGAAPPPIVDRVVQRARHLSRHERLFSEGDLVLVAVSGGQDSLCLLDVLDRLRSVCGLRLHVAHVNHGLRGAQAAEDARYVGQVAARYGAPFTGLSVDVPAYRRQHHLSTQVAARYARYQALAWLAHELGAASLAVGHTRDDLVETLLMHLLRGTGLRGLVGILPRQELRTELLGPPIDQRSPPRQALILRVVRPLLEVERRETAAYCQAVGLEPRLDPSNALRTYLRNRVRAELVPTLERYNPAVRRTLARTAAALRGDLEVVARTAEAAWERCARSQAGRIEFERAAFARELPALQRHLLRLAVERLRGTAEGLTWSAVEAGLRLATRGGPGRRLSLCGGIELATGYERFEVRLGAGGRGLEVGGGRLEARGPVPLPLPGRLELGAVGELEAEVLEGPEAVARARAEAGRAGRCQAWLDADRLGEPLQVRSWRPGDRMRPLGLGHEKKLQDILVDAKVPRELRAVVPVVESPHGIAWLAGLRVDDRFKLDDATRRVVVVQFRPGSALVFLCEE
ncbi:MAG: tRNA lysidine(34) synthetase TilS [Chloroflexi bacterium]|nr:tRNA lysidine(34) synthetase TilS [Chloroflexota bacterium]